MTDSLTHVMQWIHWFRQELHSQQSTFLFRCASTSQTYLPQISKTSYHQNLSMQGVWVPGLNILSLTSQPSPCDPAHGNLVLPIEVFTASTVKGAVLNAGMDPTWDNQYTGTPSSCALLIDMIVYGSFHCFLSGFTECITKRIKIGLTEHLWKWYSQVDNHFLGNWYLSQPNRHTNLN